MRNYVILSLVCMWLGIALACQMSFSLDSEQQWVFVGGALRIQRGEDKLYLCALNDRSLVLTTTLVCQWRLSDGVIWRRGYKDNLVITADTESIRVQEPSSPPSLSQLFNYVNGTLVNPSTGLLLSGDKRGRTKLDKPGDVKLQVTHLMNEKWYIMEGKIVSAWNGLLLTRKQGDLRVYTLPYTPSDKSLHQKWNWGEERLWNGGGNILCIGYRGSRAYMTRKNRQKPQYEKFSLNQGYIESTLRARHVLFITPDGKHVKFRKRHSY